MILNGREGYIKETVKIKGQGQILLSEEGIDLRDFMEH
jgi:hypothetical protein